MIDAQPAAYLRQGTRPAEYPATELCRADPGGGWHLDTKPFVGAPEDPPIEAKVVSNRDPVSEKPLDLASDIDEARRHVQHRGVDPMQPGRTWRRLGVDERLVLIGQHRVIV